MHILDKKRAAKHVARIVDDGLAVFMTGAAISRPEPSNIPLGYHLKRQILDAIVVSASSATSDVLIDEDSLRAILDLPFEAYMQSIQTAMGTRAAGLLAFMKRAQPNCNHKYLTEMTLRSHRKSIFTTNFDLLLEKASQNSRFQVLRHKIDFVRSSASPKQRYPSICKLHGSIDRLASIAATVSAVGRPIDAGKAKAFHQACNGATLIVLGYSGSDPDLLPMIERAPYRELVWICRPAAVPEISSGALAVLRERGATVVYADVTAFLQDCAAELKIPRPDIKRASASLSVSEHCMPILKSVSIHMRVWCLAMLAIQANTFDLAERLLAWLSRHTPRDEKHDMRKVSIYDKRGDVAYRRRQFGRARSYWKKELHYAEKIPWSIGIAAALANLGALEYQRANYSQAQDLLERGKSYENSISGRTWRNHKWQIMGHLRQNLALVFAKHESLQRAAVNFKSARRYFQKCGDIVMDSLCSIDEFKMLSDMGQQMDPGHVLDAAELVVRYGIREQAGVACLTLAQALDNQGASADAERHYSMAAEFAREADDALTLRTAEASTRG